MAIFGLFPGNTPFSAFLAKKGDFRGFSGNPGFSGIRDRGAPARGVDVKPPSRRGRGPEIPILGIWGPPGSRTTPGGAPGEPSQGPKRAPEPPGDRGPGPGPVRGGCFTSTPRGGAPRYPPGSGTVPGLTPAP